MTYQTKDFAFADDHDDAVEQRKAPPMPRRVVPAIANADRLGHQDEYQYDERPDPLESRIVSGEVDVNDMEWASNLGMTRCVTSREGATFSRISEDVFVISVYGGQYLHDDRHLADMLEEDAIGLNEHSWYLVVEPSETQMLLVEVKEHIYEHFGFHHNVLIYMNTVNRHLVSRKNKNDVVVLVQVSGYGPEERDLAVARIREVLAARPDIIPE